MKSRFYPVSQPSISDREIAYVNDAVRSGWVSSLGPYIERFEKAFASFCGTKFALTTSNGTTGLHLALLISGVRPGDEVIVPDLTFVATANAVTYVGARPIMVDVDPKTWCIDPTAIRKALSRRTKAILPVHLYGHPADMEGVEEIATREGLAVVEDAAEAHGAMYRGKPVGSIGMCGVFSFYGNKLITSGEGGMITTNDGSLYEMARRLRDHAMAPEKRYWHEQIGYNYRITNLQAALGLAQLERIDDFVAKRHEVFGWYREHLGHRGDIQLNKTASWATNALWMLCVQIKGLKDNTRSSLMGKLRERGIDSRPFFYPISDMPMYSPAETPNAHRISESGLNLPFYVDLSRDDVRHICEQFETTLDEVMS